MTRRQIVHVTAWRLISLLALGTVALTVTVADAPLVAYGSGCPRVLVPAYFYPGRAWNRAAATALPGTLMIVDVTASGAGPRPDPVYRAAIRRAAAAGITVMGYVSTGYAARPASAVHADIRHYRSWYDVRDIFFDEVSSGTAALGYYRGVAAYVRALSPGAEVAFNPGTYPARGYLSVADLVVVFEGSYASYLGLREPRWVSRYQPARFAEVIYGVPAAGLSDVMGLSRRRRAGYVYVTGSAGRNPYRALPAYWSREDAIIAAYCAA